MQKSITSTSAVFSGRNDARFATFPKLLYGYQSMSVHGLRSDASRCSNAGVTATRSATRTLRVASIGLFGESAPETSHVSAGKRVVVGLAVFDSAARQRCSPRVVVFSLRGVRGRVFGGRVFLWRDRVSVCCTGCGVLCRLFWCQSFVERAPA